MGIDQGESEPDLNPMAIPAKPFGACSLVDPWINEQEDEMSAPFRNEHGNHE